MDPEQFERLALELLGGAKYSPDEPKSARAFSAARLRETVREASDAIKARAEASGLRAQVASLLEGIDKVATLTAERDHARSSVLRLSAMEWAAKAAHEERDAAIAERDALRAKVEQLTTEIERLRG